MSFGRQDNISKFAPSRRHLSKTALEGRRRSGVGKCKKLTAAVRLNESRVRRAAVALIVKINVRLVGATDWARLDKKRRVSQCDDIVVHVSPFPSVTLRNKIISTSVSNAAGTFCRF